MIREAIEYSRNLQRHSGPHQDISHTSEHGTVDGSEVRQLELFQVVDSDRIVVAFARQNDFDKICYDAKLCLVRGECPWHALAQACKALSPPSFRRDVIPAPNTLRHFRDRKAIETAAHVAARIAILQRLARIKSRAVPDTTPSWPSWETACASRQLETLAPMPP